MIIAIVVAGIALFLLIGEWKPRSRARIARTRRWSFNTAAGILAMTSSHFAWGAVAASIGLWDLARPGPLAGLHWALRFLILMLIYDLALYIWHRFNHRSPWLWRYHRFHHLDTELDTTTSLRFHWMEFLLTGIWRVPLIWILVPSPREWGAVAALATLSAAFHHGRAWLPQRPDRALAWVVVTPRWHWGHHHPTRKHHDAQYGVIFSFWDRLFTSVSLPPDERIGLDGALSGEALSLRPLRP